MPKRKYKYSLRERRRFSGLPTPYITLLVETDVFRRRAKVSSVRFAFAPDGELLATSMPLDPNAPTHAALIAKARARALRPPPRRPTPAAQHPEEMKSSLDKFAH